MSTMLVMLNYLGTPIDRAYIEKLADGTDHSKDFEYRMLQHVLDLPPEHLPREVLDRYVEVSGKESYTTIFPHTDKLFERFLVPLKSSKRLYCFGEYLGTIELCAHLGEMLALLIWAITPRTVNGKAMDENLEKSLWGSTFERMGQDKRIDLLKVFAGVDERELQLMDHLRAVRRKYFHFWSTPIERIKDDALDCFLKVAVLVNSVLKIEYHNGAVKLNPLLARYLTKHKSAL